MESAPSAAYRGIRGYWRRKGYERLNAGGRKRNARVVELGSKPDGSSWKRRFWRIKLTPRLKLKIRFSPKRFLIWLRDAYVNMMMKLANSRTIAVGYSGDVAAGFGMRPIKEYDERMIVEIYRSIVTAQGQLAPRDAAWVGSEVRSHQPTVDI